MVWNRTDEIEHASTTARPRVHRPTLGSTTGRAVLRRGRRHPPAEVGIVCGFCIFIISARNDLTERLLVAQGSGPGLCKNEALRINAQGLKVLCLRIAQRRLSAKLAPTKEATRMLTYPVMGKVLAHEARHPSSEMSFAL